MRALAVVLTLIAALALGRIDGAVTEIAQATGTRPAATDFIPPKP